VFGNSGATITLVEFSDFSCEHCREFHTSNAISDLVSASSGTVNSLFKNVPNKKDSSSVRLAETGRCVNTLAGSGAYRTYADKIFATPDPAASSEGLQIASELKLDTTETLACATSPKTKESLDREFGQGIYLGIKVTPSTVVVNVKTGKYRIVEGNVGKSEIESVIRALSE
jgi:protein-disulfide isomerase